jgi:hypothetical protein
VRILGWSFMVLYFGTAVFFMLKIWIYEPMRERSAKSNGKG